MNSNQSDGNTKADGLLLFELTFLSNFFIFNNIFDL